MADKWAGAQISRQQHHYRSILRSDWCLVRVLDSNKAGICSSKIPKIWLEMDSHRYSSSFSSPWRRHHGVYHLFFPLQEQTQSSKLKTFWWLTRALRATWLNRSFDRLMCCVKKLKLISLMDLRWFALTSTKFNARIMNPSGNEGGKKSSHDPWPVNEQDEHEVGVTFKNRQVGYWVQTPRQPNYPNQRCLFRCESDVWECVWECLRGCCALTKAGEDLYPLLKRPLGTDWHFKSI